LNNLTFSEEKDEEFNNAMDLIFNNQSSYQGWVLLGYVSNTKISLISAGEKIEELVEYLEDNHIQYMLIRLPTTKSNQVVSRDIFIQWIGPKVSTVEKGRKGTHVGEVKQLFQPYHADLTAIGKTHFTVPVILDRSEPLSGSHVID